MLIDRTAPPNLSDVIERVLDIFNNGTVVVGTNAQRSVTRSEGRMTTAERGFASMDPAKQRELASKGGRAAHQKGTAHEWTREEARQAGRKGGLRAHRNESPQESPKKQRP